MFAVHGLNNRYKFTSRQLQMKHTINTCVEALTSEIKNFDQTLEQIKIQLEATQQSIKDFQNSPADEVNENQVQPLLQKNKKTITQLKKNIDYYMIFEKFLLHLTSDIQLASEELHTVTNSIINYFERRERYETCNAFMKLKQNI